MKDAKHQEIRFALIEQVQRAMPPAGSEMDVVTLISRPLWRMWNESNDDGPDDEPTEWSSTPQCRRVFGSETRVIDANNLVAISFSRTMPMKPFLSKFR